MTLGYKQQQFAQLIARLIQEAERRGWAVTLGEGWRSSEEAARLAKLQKGIARSLHCDRLAQDLNLFIDGEYQRATEAYRPLGVWWEARSFHGIVCAWGGHFDDGNHFSVEHEGRR